MFHLGDQVRCSITGFEGVVVAKAQWLNGCQKLGVQSTELKDGQVRAIEWFDEQQVEMVKAARFGDLAVVSGGRPGGPTQAPPRA